MVRKGGLEFFLIELVMGNLADKEEPKMLEYSPQ
jgi:hypothetical protein